MKIHTTGTNNNNDDLTKVKEQKAALLAAMKKGLEGVPHQTRLPLFSNTTQWRVHPYCRIRT
jgi:hypothetical protein